MWSLKKLCRTTHLQVQNKNNLQKIIPMKNKILVQQTSAGEPIEVNDLTIYPVARSYRIEIPAIRGGFTWNKPLAVIVEGNIGSRRILPIVDRTRQVQIAILSAGFVGALLTWLIFRKPRKDTNKEK